MYVSFFFGIYYRWNFFSKKTHTVLSGTTFLKIPPNSHFAPSIVNLWKRKFFAAIKQKIQAAADFPKKIQKSQNAEEKFWLTNKSFEKYL